MASQTQYIIKANRNCKTHREGETLVYTGPRLCVPSGWNVVEKLKQHPKDY